MSHAIVLGNRRFTCLSPHLVRIEFAPNGVFEERRSIVAMAERTPLPFAKRSTDAGWDILDTGFVQILTRRNLASPDRTTLELRWSDGKLMQLWRPDDRDHQNLGGTLRSLDRYSGESAVLDGVHVAGMESPDVSSTAWPAWLQCEVDTEYTALHPAAPADLNQHDWLKKAREPFNRQAFLERTFNWYNECRSFCPGVLSASGYFFLNDSTSAVMDSDNFPIERERPGYQDWYFFAYASDYEQALKDFRLLCGPAPVPPHRSLGIMYSRWPAFSETEIEELVSTFNGSGHPLSTLVMDMEWHKEGWGHWEFDPKLIPDAKKFFARCHAHGLDVTFNDHPLDVRDDDVHFADYVAQAGPDLIVRTREYNGKMVQMAKVDITNKQQNQAFARVCHTHILDHGLDFWWNDGSRGQMAGTCGQLVTNKTFFEESERGGRRGMLLARWGGLGSHRYGAFFTGDATSDFHVLALECEFTIRAGGVGLSHISHDIGGFCTAASALVKNKAGVDLIDPVMYLRWLQFGVFNPILRFHSAPGSGSRKPADYEDEVGGACRTWLRQRHAMLPYLYTAARHHHDTGIPLVRGLFLSDSRNPAAYRFDQYGFGPALLVAPMLTRGNEREIYLPPGQWWAFGTNTQIAGGTTFTRSVALHEVPVYAKAGSIVTLQSPDAPLHAAHVAELILDVYAGADGSAELYEDDGVSTDYRKNVGCHTHFALTDRARHLTLTSSVTAGRPLGAQRTITVLLSWATAPTSVQLNGKTLSVTPEGGRWRINLPALPAADGFTLDIRA